MGLVLFIAIMVAVSYLVDRGQKPRAGESDHAAFSSTEGTCRTGSVVTRCTGSASATM